MTHTTALRRLEGDLGDLLERRERGADLGDLARYADDPVGFIVDVLGQRLLSYQAEIAESVRDHSLVTVVSCQGAGKDALAGFLSLWAAYSCDALVVIQAPTMDQVRTVLFGEIGRAFHGSDLPGELFTSALRIPRPQGHGGIIGRTSTVAGKLTGYHAPQVLVVLSEGQNLEPHAYEAAYALAVGASDKILCIGNPTRATGDFHRIGHSDAWRVHTLSAFDVFAANEELDEPIRGLISPIGLERMATEWGDGSPSYLSRGLAIWPTEDTHGLCRRVWLDAAAERYESGELTPSGEPIVALDVARFGPDESVAAIRRGPVLERIESWRRLDTMETSRRVIELAREVRVRPHAAPGEHRSVFVGRGPYGTLVIDEIGMGSGVVDFVREQRFKVAPFNSARRAVDAGKFQNRRAESFWNLRVMLEEGRIALPFDELLWDELVTLRWQVSADGRIQMMSKDDLRAELGRSSDRSDAVSMAFSGEDSRHEWRRVRFRP